MTEENTINNERRGQARRATDRAVDELKAIYSSLKYIADGIVLLNHDGTVYFETEQARKILSSIKHLVRIEEKIMFSRHHDYDRFAKFLSKLNAQAKNTEELTEQCVFSLERDANQPSVVMTCFAFRGDEDRIIVVIHDPQTTVPQWASFAQFFQLTQTELRLCLALTEGFTLNSYSEKYHVSINTARSQLKTIFSKTETRRQADLLRLIFSFTRH
jgi:DNA-binding CsgD family transcriptional regulator